MHQVEHNDILIMVTDGVTDNLFDEQIIEECISPHLTLTGELPSLQEAALCISSMAEAFSYSQTDETPWTVGAVANGRNREDELGGKEDDITVIVAQVKLHNR